MQRKIPAKYDTLLSTPNKLILKVASHGMFNEKLIWHAYDFSQSQLQLVNQLSEWR